MSVVMDKFEYMEQEPPNAKSFETIVDWLNRLGADGWELVWMTEDYISAIFKRKVTTS